MLYLLRSVGTGTWLDLCHLLQVLATEREGGSHCGRDLHKHQALVVLYVDSCCGFRLKDREQRTSLLLVQC